MLEQVRTARETHALVGVHGMALAHMVFMPAMSLVVELDRGSNFHYVNWAAFLGHTYKEHTRPEPVDIAYDVARFFGCGGRVQSFDACGVLNGDGSSCNAAGKDGEGGDLPARARFQVPEGDAVPPAPDGMAWLWLELPAKGRWPKLVEATVVGGGEPGRSMLIEFPQGAVPGDIVRIALPLNEVR